MSDEKEHSIKIETARLLSSLLFFENITKRRHHERASHQSRRRQIHHHRTHPLHGAFTSLLIEPVARLGPKPTQRVEPRRSCRVFNSAASILSNALEHFSEHFAPTHRERAQRIERDAQTERDRERAGGRGSLSSRVRNVSSPVHPRTRVACNALPVVRQLRGRGAICCRQRG